MNDTVTYFHPLNAGDLCSCLAGIRQIWRDTGKKAIIYQQINRYGNYYDGADHPLRDSRGNMVTMNQEMFNMLRPLIIAQEYVEDFRVWNGEKCIVDLSVIHVNVIPFNHEGQILYHTQHPKIPAGLPFGSINRWLFYAYPDMATDLSEAWIDRGKNDVPLVGSKVLINFTSRYRNDLIDYSFLKDYEPYINFVGTDQEYDDFCSKWGLVLDHLKVTDFVQLRDAMNEATFFLGNQSFCWNLAEAMKIPRILEICPEAPNCIPNGKDGYDFYHQGALEYYFKKLFNR